MADFGFSAVDWLNCLLQRYYSSPAPAEQLSVKFCCGWNRRYRPSCSLLLAKKPIRHRSPYCRKRPPAGQECPDQACFHHSSHQFRHVTERIPEHHGASEKLLNGGGGGGALEKLLNGGGGGGALEKLLNGGGGGGGGGGGVPTVMTSWVRFPAAS